MNEDQKQLHDEWLACAAAFEESALRELKVWRRYGWAQSSAYLIPDDYRHLMDQPAAYVEHAGATTVSPLAAPIQDRWQGLVDAIAQVARSLAVAAECRDIALIGGVR